MPGVKTPVIKRVHIEGYIRMEFEDSKLDPSDAQSQVKSIAKSLHIAAVSGRYKDGRQRTCTSFII